MKLQILAGAAVLGIGCISCSTGVPYTSLSDVPGLTQWHVVYQDRNTASNGGCEDGNDCRAYGVLLSPSRDLAKSIGALVMAMRRRGWLCAVSHSVKAAALINSDGRRFVEFVPVDALARDRGLLAAYMGGGLLAAASQTAAKHLPAIAVEVTHTSSPDKADLQTRPATPSLCH